MCLRNKHSCKGRPQNRYVVYASVHHQGRQRSRPPSRKSTKSATLHSSQSSNGSLHYHLLPAVQDEGCHCGIMQTLVCNVRCSKACLVSCSQTVAQMMHAQACHCCCMATGVQSLCNAQAKKRSVDREAAQQSQPPHLPAPLQVKACHTLHPALSPSAPTDRTVRHLAAMCMHQCCTMSQTKFCCESSSMHA